MAQTTTNEFSLDALASLSGNPDDIYRAIAYFETWRPFFSESLSRLTQNLDADMAKAYIDGDTEHIQKLFAEFLETARLLPARESMLVQEKETPHPTEPYIENFGQTIKLAREEVTAARMSQTTESRRLFIKKLVDNYSKMRPDVPEKILSAVEQKLKTEPTKPPSDIIRETVSEATPARDASKKIAREIEIFIGKTRAGDEEFSVGIGSSILSSPKPEKTARSVVDVLTAAKSQDIPLQNIIAHARGVTAGSIALSSGGETQGQIVSAVKNNFFSAISQTVTQKAVWAPLADIATTILGRDKVIEYLYEQTVKDIAKRFGKSFAKSEGRVNTIGEALFSSEAFRNLITDSQKHIADSSGTSSSLLSPARGFVDNLIRPIFAKPLEESAVAYMHAVYIEKIPISVALQQYYLIPAATPQKEGGGILSWILGLGGEAGTGALADAGMKKVAGTTVGGAVKTGISAAAITLFGWTPPGWVVAAATWFGSSVIMPIAKFIFGGIGNILSGGPLRLLMMGGIETEEGKRELMQLTLLAGIPILIIIILFMFPSPFNVQYMEQMQNDLAFINTGIDGLDENGMGTGEFSETPPPGVHVPMIDCDYEPQNPLCHLNDCSSPVMQAGKMWPTSGSITQGPYTTCGNTSHRNLDAIDIGAASGTSVYATTNGTITSINSGCTDNIHGKCGGGYGNYVLVQSDNGYTLTFGHLMQGSLSSLKVGMRVESTTSIGRVDDNGNSTGPHLHFGYKGPGSINDILPAAIPSCANNTAGCSACGYPVQACIQ